MRIAAISADPLDVAAHEQAVAHPGAGATVLFTGVVRDVDHDRAVRELEYQAHPSAQDVLVQVVAEFGARPEVIGIAVSHRIGELKVGDVALVAAVSTRHRAAAFTICTDLVDAVKSRLPIWKRQLFDDGSDEWVNCP